MAKRVQEMWVGPMRTFTKNSLITFLILSVIICGIFAGFLAILVDDGEIGRTPKLGDIYEHQFTDPFEITPKCVVLDVKKGWVKYQIQDNNIPKTCNIVEFRKNWSFVIKTEN